MLTLLVGMVVASNTDESRRIEAVAKKIQDVQIQIRSTRLTLRRMDFEAQEPDNLLMVQEALKAGAADYVTCYEQGFPQKPPPMIQVSLGVNITAHGHIRRDTGLSNGSYARVDQPAFASQPFERCIEQALQHLRFAPPKDKKTGFFAQKIVLEPGSASH
jgi:hypothetical protein